MKTLYLKPYKVLPGIFFNHETGILKIYGISSPVNANEFYIPILEWIDTYIENPHTSTVLEVYLNYFNTVSAKILMTILKKMETLSKAGKKVKIRWVYLDIDESLQDAGEDFEQIIDVEFEFVALKKSGDMADSQEDIDNLIDTI